MEEDEIQAQACKFPRVGNGRNESNKIGSSRRSEQCQDEEEDVEPRRRGGGGGSDGSTNHFQSNWHHSSRIIRVSRASGGKDRHSKVMTSKGLRDRRVRLSVTTAIQFYDLQDRLGYDQPSKAVEWLINAASDAISELPSLNNPFPDTPKQPSDEKRPSDRQGFDDGDGDNSNYQQNQSQNLSLSKSACSSTSETSKGSGLSLSRSEIRVNREKARERARERAAKEKEKEKEKDKEKEKENNNDQSSIAHHHHDVNVNHPMSHTASFTELLTGGIGSTVTVPTTASPNGSVHQIHGGNDEVPGFWWGVLHLQELSILQFSQDISNWDMPFLFHHSVVKTTRIISCSNISLSCLSILWLLRHLLLLLLLLLLIPAGMTIISTSQYLRALLVTIGGPFSPILRLFCLTCRGFNL
ncbi:hypothetical protein VNO77_25621 [Canavalia gladiata]|uniref:Transcription factor TCP2 n=1 Tax=Canavalia gladiata TaxID=3824 RepID=A0AAN9QDP7_CANGL